MKHLDELTLLRMADGELADDREQSTRTHLLECARCRSSYEVLQAETAVMRAALRDQDAALPESLRTGADLSWLLVAGGALAVLGVTTFWNHVVEPMLRGMNSVGLDGASLFTTVLIRSVLWRGWMDMATTVFQGVVALVIVGAAASALVWGWRRFRDTTAVLCFTLLFGIGLSERDASAAVIEIEQDSYLLREGERVDNDLVVAGERVVIEGVVTGDLIVATRYLEVSGEIQGDILGIAEEIDVTGTVGGSLRTGSRSLAIEGTIGRNVTSAGETLRLRSGGRVLGSFTAAGREVLLSGPVERDLIVGAQLSELNGRLGGSALLGGETLSIGPEAGIEGEVTFYGQKEPEVSPSARLASEIVYKHVEHEENQSTAVSWVTHFVYFWAAAFVLGVALLLVAPATAETLRAVHVPDYGKSLLVGVLSVLVTLVTGGFLCVTLIGLPLGFVVLFLLALGIYVAQVYVGLYLGSEILGAPTDVAQTLGRLALGLFVIHLGESVPILGTLVWLAIAVWGFGAITLLALDRAPWTGGAAPRPAEAST